MKILCLHPASSLRVSLGRGKKTADYSKVIKPVTIRDERPVTGTVCPHTPVYLISIGKAGRCGHPWGISWAGRLGSALSCIHLISCQVQELLSALFVAFLLVRFVFCWWEACMKISTRLKFHGKCSSL